MTKRRSGELWVGFLEAGKSSSPVVRDLGLDTGNPRTVYLFHLARERILEYRRDIVEQKLRELSAEELGIAAPLQEAFWQARADFVPRALLRSAPAPRRRVWHDEADEPDDDHDAGLPAFDDDGEPMLAALLD